jgi:hypothetical protein
LQEQAETPISNVSVGRVGSMVFGSMVRPGGF